MPQAAPIVVALDADLDLDLPKAIDAKDPGGQPTS